MTYIGRLPARIALAVVFLASAASCRPSGDEFDALYRDLPFEMPRVQQPRIPARSVNLQDFGAVADGQTLNTDAFAKALQTLSDKGGGRLIVPEGIWRTGPITLLSRTELHLEKGAVILFDSDRRLYPVIDTNFEGLDVRRCLSPINATDVHDIAITGSGIIDGNGQDWRELKKRNAPPRVLAALCAKGGFVGPDGSWYPDEGYYKARLTAGNLNKPSDELNEAEIVSFLRPVMVSIRNCERVLLEGCTFQNSPCWNIHPLWCKDLIVKNVDVRNPAWATNGDGIDIDGCENVIVTGSRFDVGDDAVCIKSGKDADGRRHARPCRKLIIHDCTVYSGHGGFVVGSEMSGGVEDIHVSHCRYLGTEVGLRFKSTRGRGGEVRGIWADHIYMQDIINYGVIFNLYYMGTSAGGAREAGEEAAVPVDETTPSFHDIHFSDIVCAGAGQSVFINGLPEMPIRNVSFTRCRFDADKGAEVHYAEDVRFPLSQQVVRSEMKRHPDAAHLDGLEGRLKWNYTTGLELKALLDVYERYGDRAVFDYAERWYDAIIDSTGRIATYKKGNYSTDHVCPGRTLFYLYDKTGKEKYRMAMDTLRAQLHSQPRTPEGGFWHKKIYPQQMWLDGLYMAQPFYAEYTARYEEPERRDSCYRDILHHFLTVAKYTYDPATRLYRHAWDSSHEMFWADPQTGQSKHAWGRALGWYCMAVVDVLPFIPEKTEGRAELLKLFRGICKELRRNADPETGMWYQVLDRPGAEGNYVEASASAMFVYALLKGVRLGLLDGSYADYARQSYERLLTTFVKEQPDGTVDLERVCEVAGLGGKQMRSGDYDYYIHERICANDPKGIGPLIWAALEYESL